MFGTINVNNFYRTTTDSVIDDITDVGTFDVVDKIVDGITLLDGDYIFWLVIQIEDSSKREIFRCTNVTGHTITYDRRISPNGKFAHDSGSLVSLNDFSEVINMLSGNIDTFGYTENITGTGNELKVKVYGGRVFSDSALDISVSNTILTLPDDIVSYVYYDDAINEFNSTIVEPSSYYVVAKVTTLSGIVLSIEDYRAKIVTVGGGSAGGDGHTIKNTTQGGVQSTLTQRDTIRTKKLNTIDDPVNLETIIEGKRIATPDYIATGNTEYIEPNTQMVIEGTLTIDGTLDNEGTLVLI